MTLHIVMLALGIVADQDGEMMAGVILADSETPEWQKTAAKLALRLMDMPRWRRR